jgi:hypothetical protein
MNETADPLLQYKKRLHERQAAVEKHERRHHSVGTLRLILGLAIPITLYFSFLWTVVPLILFVVLVIVHGGIAEARRQARKAVAFYEMGLARIEDRWIGKGQSTEVMRTESHLYAADLDVFGKASLFELLCTARTRAGEEILADWLAVPANRDVILERQQGVAEIRSRIDLREDLAIVGADIRPEMHPDAMVAWGVAPALFNARLLRVVCLAATAFVGGVLLAWFWTGTPIWLKVYYYSLVAQGALFLLIRRRVDAIVGPVEWPAKYLAMLSAMLARLEREPFQSPPLARLKNRLSQDAQPASRTILRLGRLVDALTWKGLDLFFIMALALQTGVIIPLTIILLWTPQLAISIEQWRRRFGPSIERWLTLVGEYEAFCALGTYSYEHPADPFPEIVSDGPVYQGDNLKHPLIPGAQCVENSVHLGGDLRLLVVSGSNMSGKSTLLRTVGINAVLALSGAPIRATRLRISPVAMGSTIRIQDSLQAGTSRFYAEIQRIRQIVDLAEGPLPVLFLLDEVLHGTNSHDRAIGAEAIVRGLLDRGAIGLATTHDLALTAVAEALAPKAANVHFEDHLEDGKMRFDYRMRSGVVKRSNALELMRAVGLEV